MNRLSNRVKKVESITCHYHFSTEAHLEYLVSKGVTQEAMTWAIENDSQAIELRNRLGERLQLLNEQTIKIPKTFWLLGRKEAADNRLLAYVIEYDNQAKRLWNHYLLRIGNVALEYVQNTTATNEDGAGNQAPESATAIDAG